MSTSMRVVSMPGTLAMPPTLHDATPIPSPTVSVRVRAVNGISPSRACGAYTTPTTVGRRNREEECDARRREVARARAGAARAHADPGDAPAVRARARAGRPRLHLGLHPH